MPSGRMALSVIEGVGDLLRSALPCGGPWLKANKGRSIGPWPTVACSFLHTHHFAAFPLPLPLILRIPGILGILGIRIRHSRTSTKSGLDLICKNAMRTAQLCHAGHAYQHANPGHVHIPHTWRHSSASNSTLIVIISQFAPHAC